MSGMEALARVLAGAYGWPRHLMPIDHKAAERILADPGPLLAALAEAGVLRKEWCSRNASGGGAIYLDRESAESDRDRWNADLCVGIDEPPRSPVVAVERRYVTEWRADD